MGRGRAETSDQESESEGKKGSSKPRKKVMEAGKPLELFRTHLISAMKIGDNEFVDRSKVIKVSDQWRHEWNNGVQIPVGHNEDQHSVVNPVKKPSSFPTQFKMTRLRPKKPVRLSKDGEYSADRHTYSDALQKAEEVCRYDLDDIDTQWLRLLNDQRKAQGSSRIGEEEVERLMERFEFGVYEGVQADLQDSTAYARGREFEEDSVCDVCWMPDSSEENQMVFCDRCDLAVHQVCYGTGTLPEGNWLCRTCTIQPNAQCALCPNRGGALKCTRTGLRWAHVSCVWWIPEVKFEDPDTMEPIIHISKIPADRWNLKCAVCGKREGACIQCSSHKCPVAYHVTCAQMSQPDIHMQWETGGDDGVNLVSFCRKHTRTFLSRKSGQVEEEGSPQGPSSSHAPIHASISYSRPSISGRPHDSPLKRKLKRQALLESLFYLYVKPGEVSKELSIDPAVTDAVFEYWKLKRRSRRNESMMTPKVEEELILEKHDREVLMRKVKVFVALRQNLEKARNLCYMVQKRERLKRQYLGLREENFTALSALSVPAMSQRELEKLSLTLNATSEYEQEAFCSAPSPPPSTPPPLSPSDMPKTLVHLKRIPAAQLAALKRRTWTLPSDQERPLLPNKDRHSRLSMPEKGRLVEISVVEDRKRGMNGFSPKRTKLSSALIRPLRRSLASPHRP